MSKRRKCTLFCRIDMPNVLIELEGKYMDSETLHAFSQTNVRHSKLNRQELDRRKLNHCVKTLQKWKIGCPIGNLQNDIDAIISRLGQQVLDPFMVNQFFPLFSRKCFHLVEQFLSNGNLVKTLRFSKIFGAIYEMTIKPEKEDHKFDWFNIAYAIDHFATFVFTQKSYLISKIFSTGQSSSLEKICASDWFDKYRNYWRTNKLYVATMLKDIDTGNIKR